MKAPDFDYHRPDSLSGALALLGEHGEEAFPLAGGQSLMPMMNFRIAQPQALIDLARVPELRGVERTEGELRIGAMTTWRELGEVPGLERDLPLVAAALPHIAHDAVRNRGTVGGSLALADPAAELPALVLALGGTIELAGASRRREVAAEHFFLGFYETARGEDELVAALRLPVAREGQVFGFHELVRRHGDYALAGAAVVADAAAPLSNLRFALFAVGGRPVRATGVEAALEGGAGSADEIGAALGALEEIEFEADAQVPPSLRRHYAGVALKRAIRGMLG